MAQRRGARAWPSRSTPLATSTGSTPKKATYLAGVAKRSMATVPAVRTAAVTAPKPGMLSR